MSVSVPNPIRRPAQVLLGLALMFASPLVSSHSVDRASMRVSLTILPVPIVTVSLLDDEALRDHWPGLDQTPPTVQSKLAVESEAPIRYRIHSPL